ncbi:hypothetical protein IDH50_06835 [Aeromicrobium tamlense]|uniref:Uncharacterized protein n=1 Tax=Aeromicrobium tamlense TaxID=375541 RepID=A0A8I0FUI0_9ACTN|nr:hypothetical protein [Aeromicrobium tamlense]MBD1269938.1 hypothetical protein [Aeromicrobium tamlense]NYI39405.1 hypothetical protein [Aeromicrobium tamlense]
MADRTASWFLIQFTADLARREPRNVGVVLETPQGWLTRFVAHGPDGVDGRRLRRFRLPKNAYEEWVGYFHRNIDGGTWDRVLETSKVRNFRALRGGEIYEDRDWNVELDRLFGEMVETRDEESSEGLKNRVKRILTAADVTSEEDYAVEVDYGDDHRSEVSWDFAYRNGSLWLMEGLRLGGALARTQAEAFYGRAKGTEKAMSAGGGLPKFVCFLDGVVGLSDDVADRILAPIDAVAHAVDVDDEERAIEEVAAMFHRSSQN